jgi:hypothetical protein
VFVGFQAELAGFSWMIVSCFLFIWSFAEQSADVQASFAKFGLGLVRWVLARFVCWLFIFLGKMTLV